MPGKKIIVLACSLFPILYTAAWMHSSHASSLGEIPSELRSELPLVESRHTMAHCHYVFRVDSEIRVHTEQWGAYSLQMVFDNSWSDEEEDVSHWILPPNEEGLFSIHFESMSVSEDYLYRDMSFSFGVHRADGEFDQKSPTFFSDVGREFGEKCRLFGDDEASFFERTVVRSM